MQDSFFVNSAIQNAIELFIKNKDNKYNVEYNSFNCSVIRMLCIIYGEDSIINAYNSRNTQEFDSALLKYGYDVNELNNFKIVFDKFCRSEEKHQSKAIKKKNKHFNIVQKYLIDMMVKKNSVESVNSLEMNEFCELLFTANSKDFYRKSTAVLLAYNPYEIYEYAKKQNIIVG